jgi:hypothetical protein
MKPNDTSSGKRRGIPKPVTQQQIAALAHEIWLARGSPEGSDLDIWLEAERQLTQGIVTRPTHRDPIPADPDRISPDEDPAVNDGIRGELDRLIERPAPRGPTSLT